MHNEFPTGFSAKKGNVSVQFSRENDGYRMKKMWTDGFSGKPREMDAGFYKMATPEAANAFITDEAIRYQSNGWNVQILSSQTTEAAKIVSTLLNA